MATIEQKDPIILEIDNVLTKVENKVKQLDTPIQSEEEECLPCKYNVGVGLGISICREAELKGIDCDELKAQYTKEDGEPLDKKAKTLMDTIIKQIGLEKTEDKPFSKQLTDLNELKELMGLVEPNVEPSS